ncbi:NAD(P)/FAD-dependent oxidoreductase [Granulosicoccus antarcticus]|uniref:Gamma-glutamylputrescine oxidoreductase n=1 Tax=Granulosicoccus antarcticus IMCC3135 TaxID=1192854 RepID=A0A2Z2P8H3_9GAMM|nr:FAD-binding oxidoreductase [Granulosicoccus antarcticus]ASJ76164.1 Gamma-glutamylputrescine oxidoreductase [Granulosicoccus antarcticus IMCC3135]
MTSFTASRLPNQPGPAGWNCLLPEALAARILEQSVTADVAIIGAGFAGLSAARRLLQIDPCLKVVVLEAGRVAQGPAGRNSGFMIDLPHDLSSDTYVAEGTADDTRQISQNRQAIRFAASAAEEYALTADTFNPCGKINAAATLKGEKLNQDYARHLAVLNEPHEWLDTAALVDLTGSHYYRSGLFTPGTVMLQPAGYIRGLANGLQFTHPTAFSLFENSPVIRIVGNEPGWTLECPTGKVIADKVILANNGHAESFGFFQNRLLHVFTYATMTKPFARNALAGNQQWGIIPADPMGTTVRRINDGDASRLVIRTRFTYNPSMQVSPREVADAAQLCRKKYDARFPDLKTVDMQYEWAGHLCLSWNGVPAHGEIEKGIFSAVCQNGLGTAKGTISGISAAEMACGVDTEITRSLATMDEPRRLPPAPLTTLGARTTLKWKEWRASRE